jgi:hypothetical protein
MSAEKVRRLGVIYSAFVFFTFSGFFVGSWQAVRLDLAQAGTASARLVLAD